MSRSGLDILHDLSAAHWGYAQYFFLNFSQIIAANLHILPFVFMDAKIQGSVACGYVI